MRPWTVLLFDVDGTLVLTGGAGRRALAAAFEDVVDCAGALDSVDFRGQTDLALLRAGLEAAGRPFDPGLVSAIVARYLDALDRELEGCPAYHVLPGATALLTQLQRFPAIAVGLGTGNLERGARLKLGPGRLNDFFTFGGFGDDHEDRAELLRYGARRGAAELGRTPDECRVVVIGDTPRDVAAAHAIGATCVGVATGGYPQAALAAAGAALVVTSLADERVLPALEHR